MQRRQFIRNTGLSTGLLALSSKSLLANFFQQPAFAMKNLRNEVGIFTERGGTIAYYPSKEGYIIVDSQFPDPAKHLIEALQKTKEMPFRLLINTHHHGDHTGGNISFKGIVQNVAGHKNCLSNYQRVSEQNKSTDKQLFQDITFGDTWHFKAGKEKIRAHYFGAAHTNGDAIIHFEEANIAHMGDLLFNQIHPFIDRSAGANIKNWITVMEKTRNTFDKDTLFVFGHGATPEKIRGTLEDVAAFENYLQKLLAFVGGEIKSGKTRDEIIKQKEIPGLSWQASGAERSLTAAYDELTSS